jgi:hypothetical protein
VTVPLKATSSVPGGGASVIGMQLDSAGSNGVSG